MEYARIARGLLRGLVMLTLPVAVCAGAEAPEDDFSRGWQAYQSEHYDGALQLWMPLAAAGDPEAQLNIGVMYDAGQGVPADPSRAVNWYRKSAEYGHAAAQYNLGMMYVAGRGVGRDPVIARYWLELAAGQGLQAARAVLPDLSDTTAGALPRSARTDHELFIDTLSGTSTGTAWSVTGGYAVTSNHVVEACEHVTLYDVNGRMLPATVVIRDIDNDLAVLSVTDVDVDHLPPGLPLSSVSGRLGSDVFTLGFPLVDVLGRTPKLTEGIISSVNGYRDDPASYQTSLQIQPGNSGGPLLNMDGEVVGIVSAMLGTESDIDVPMPSISYAVKVEVLQDLLRALPEYAVSADTARGQPAPRADLAERIQPSLLLVVAAD